MANINALNTISNKLNIVKVNKNLLLDLNLQPGVAILLLVLFVALSGVAIYFLIRGIKKERERLIADRFKINELDRIGFIDYVKHKYATATENTKFTVMLLSIEGAENLKSSLGALQYAHTITTLRERLMRVIPHGSRMCEYEEGVIALFIEEEMDNVVITNICTMCITECYKPIVLLAHAKFNVSINIGVASNNQFSPDFEQLLQNCEIALANAQRDGINKFAIYSEQLAERQTDEYKQYQQIKNAISQNQFLLYYQPIYNLNEKKVIAYETLVRWQHPTLGILTPSRFLPIMEQTGDVYWIGTWAFEEMLKAQTLHLKNHPEDSDLIFSCNISPKQLMDPHLAENFRKIYKKYKIPAQNICMEIVEFSIFDKVPEVSSNILKLTQMGFRIAIDDFGIEMSSFKLLDNMTFDWVKIDRKFIEQSQDDLLIGGVVGTLVNFASHKNFKIIAEGVEDEATLEYIKSLKITYGQGYYLGKPMMPEEYDI